MSKTATAGGVVGVDMVARERDTGRYMHSAEAMCVCGHPVSVHAAEKVGGERPCFDSDAPGGTGSDCECVVFRKVRAKK